MYVQICSVGQVCQLSRMHSSICHLRFLRFQEKKSKDNLCTFVNGIRIFLNIAFKSRNF